MPDNFYHIDDPFTDRSWSEMKKLLDREMPVRPVPFFRRRKGLLWLLLFLVPVGIAWGYFQWGMKEAHPAPSTPELQLPVPSPTVKAVAALEANEECDDLISKKARPASPAKDDFADIQVQKISESQVLAVTHGSVLDPIATASFQPDPRLYSLKGYSLVEFQKPSPVARAWSVGLEGGPLAYDGFRTTGVSGGLVVGRSFGNSRWGVRSGLGYSYISNPFPTQTLVQTSIGEDISSYDSFPVNFLEFDSNVQAYASSADSSISRLHFLDLPVVVTYQPGRHWQFHAGPGVSLLLATQTEAGRHGNSGVFSNTKESSDLNPITGAVNSIPQKVELFNPYVAAGVTFFPLPRWGIGAQADLGLRDMLPNWPGEQFVSKAQVKISYRFQ